MEFNLSRTVGNYWYMLTISLLMDFYTTILIIFVRMISIKKTTIALLAISAVLVLFAAAPLVTTHQANAFWGGGSGRARGWGGGCGGWGGGCGGCGGWW